MTRLWATLGLVGVMACGAEKASSDMHALSMTVDGADVLVGSYDGETGEVFLVGDLVEAMGMERTTIDGVVIEGQGAFVSPGLDSGDVLQLENATGTIDVEMRDAGWVDGLPLDDAERRLVLCADFGYA